MNKLRTLCTVVLSAGMAMMAYAGSKTEPVDYVSTLVGTASSYEISTGNTYPAIAMPWGMNFWVPQTGKNGDGWTYTYSANKIRGFKQTHQPSPWINDYGMFSLMPVTGRAIFDEEQRASWFSHKAEKALPYYYRAYLADYDVVTEIAPTERAASFRFTFPETDSAFVVVDAYHNGSYVKILPQERKIVGYTTFNHGGVPEGFRNYFVITFDKDFTYTATVDKGVISRGIAETANDHAGAIIGFKTRKGEVVNARVASSFISAEQAEVNLGEIGNRSFDDVCKAGRQRWNEVLGRVEVKDQSLDHLRTFYSCLYRSVLFPRAFWEVVDGQPMHYSPYNGKVEKGYMYTDTGFWDTFRSLFPLLNLLYPSENAKMQEGLANAYRESGFLPEWASPGHRGCMVGNNSASVVADAIIKGVRTADAETLWQAVVHGTQAVHPEISSTGRLGYEYYNKLGYVPYDVDIKENVARTLEYAYDDWCIYQMGKALGKKDKELRPFKLRAMNYRKVFDPETRLMRGKLKNGEFQTPFNPLKWGDAFTEGNSWHYTWSVFHDPQGLIDLMGGNEAFVTKLDSLFFLESTAENTGFVSDVTGLIGQYAHGNEPSHHVAYLYSYAGHPEKTQQVIREVFDRFYLAKPDGLCGNDDCGQMSAWYIFSAMGFYPVNPISGEYVLGAPQIEKISLSLPEGKTFTVEAKGLSKTNKYVKSVELNGKPVTGLTISHKDVMNGGNLVFTMTDQPGR